VPGEDASLWPGTRGNTSSKTRSAFEDSQRKLLYFHPLPERKSGPMTALICLDGIYILGIFRARKISIEGNPGLCLSFNRGYPEGALVVVR
jgi:hypothetical protein